VRDRARIAGQEEMRIWYRLQKMPIWCPARSALAVISVSSRSWVPGGCRIVRGGCKCWMGRVGRVCG